MARYEGLSAAVLNALFDCGVYPVIISPPEQRHPLRITVALNNEVVELWVYIWTLTHGGGERRPRDEYRIQLTGVRPPLRLNETGGPTLLLGYEPGLACFAGFDVSKHRTFSTKSPSIQIPITALQAAQRNGFAFSEKGNEEIAVALRPEQMLTYALNAELLHREGADAETVALLSNVANDQPVLADELEQLPVPRQRMVRRIEQLYRSSRFRSAVLVAYGRTCAVTGMQLRLIDAAHILPVGVADSTDLVSNGLCLSPTIHRAYDQALIYLDEEYAMRLNPAQAHVLAEAGEAQGLDGIKALLDRRILLPAARGEWPSPAMIRRANEVRKIRGYG